MRKARDERRWSAVPRWVLGAFGALLALEIAWSATRPPPTAHAEDLPAPPSEAVLRLAALGEPVALGKALMLWLQAFDYQSGTRVPFRQLDYTRLTQWLERILALDPAGQYPLLAASRLYAEVPDPHRQRQMLEFIHQRFLEDPNRRWPSLAHATIVAKHNLKDLPLARRYAVSLQKTTTAQDVPVWVRQMEPFILEDMNELETARIMIGGMLESGQIRDSRDADLLSRRLKMLEEKIKGGARR
ncbi:MAG: hypothetical protein ABIU95_04395 [Burkholderiales bacterium]